MSDDSRESDDLRLEKPYLQRLRKLVRERRIHEQMAAELDPHLERADYQVLLHEILVYQEELEIQNEELRRSQGQLQEARNHYVGLYHNAPVAYITLSPRLQILQANQAARQLFGMGDQDIGFYSPFTMYVDQDELATCLKYYKHVFDHPEQVHTGESRLRVKDGKGRIVRLESLVLREDGGEMQCQTALVDITAQRAAEERIRLQAGALEAAANGIVITETDGVIRWVNPAFSRLTGYAFDKVVGQTPNILRSGVHDQAFYARMWTTILSGQVWQGEVVNRNHEGNLYTEEMTITPLANDQGKVTHFIAIKQDITQRKASQEKIHHQFRQLQTLHALDAALTENLDLPATLEVLLEEVKQYLRVDAADILLVEPDQHHLRCAAHCGFSPEMARACEETLRQEEALCAAKAIRWQNVVSFQQIEHMDCERRAVFLEQGFTSYVGVPLQAKGRMKGVMEILLRGDIPRDEDWFEFLHTVGTQAAIAIDNAHLFSALQSERDQLARRVAERTAGLRRANTELQRAVRLKDEFLANISHELRTPLSAILNVADILVEGVYGELSDKQTKVLQTVKDSGQHLLSIISDILDVSKYDAGQLHLNLDSVHPREVIESSVNLMQQTASKKQLTVEVDLDPAVGRIMADGLRLKQILVNLLSNAIKFTPANGRVGVILRGYPTREQLEIQVWDTGIGISQEDLIGIFEPFVQLDGGLARSNEGTGLGLALVRNLTELHHGTVTARSTPGEGSLFTVTLPWHEQPKPSIANSGEAEVAPSLDTQRILLFVDDNENNRLLLAEFLEAKGYQVIQAGDAPEGLRLAREHHPDLIIMDIQLPGMSGLDAIRALRQSPLLSQIPVLALTALAMPGDEQQCLAAGADAYLSKPVQIDVLLRRLANLLAVPA